MKISLEQAEKVGVKLGVNWDKARFSSFQFLAGMHLEWQEEGFETCSEAVLERVGKLALANLKKDKSYYYKAFDV